MMNRISSMYRALYSSREDDMDEKSIHELIEKLNHEDNPPYDTKIVEKYFEKPQFVEKEIIKYILDMEHMNLDMEYLSLYAQQMNASSIKVGNDKAIFVDELLTFTILSFFLTVYSYAHDKSSENLERCVNSFQNILKKQGEEHTIHIYNFLDTLKMISLPKHILNIAMDSFWTAWTFVIGHELYHLYNPEIMTTPLQDEYNADKYGYQVLIHMIEKQKNGEIPEKIKVYYEHMYLSPIMLFEYFMFFDKFKRLKGETIYYTDHPSPKNREEQIFKLFDDYIPNTLDTEQGNELLNIFLDSKEELEKITFQRYFND